MNETFCGKNCGNCAWREEHNCNGCQNGPGGRGGNCEIASCCREKGHETCHTCNFQLNCQLLQARDEVPQRRQYVHEAREERKQWHAQNAPILGKWLWLMFWLIIPNSIGSLMRMNSVIELLPALKIPGEILGILCSLLYAFFLWKLQEVDRRYRTAAIWLFVTVPIVALTNLLDMGSDGDLGKAGLALLILIPATVIEFYACYLEYYTHSAVLEGLDDELAGKWPKLWKWWIGVFLGLFGCIVLLFIAPMLALLALLADAIGILVVAILKLVYIYRTAKLFREYALPDSTGLPEKATISEE